MSKMVDNFEWEESDDKWTEYDATNEVTTDAIYEVNCPGCDDSLYCESFDPDADNPSWLYKCHDCELYVRAKPSTVTAHASDMNL